MNSLLSACQTKTEHNNRFGFFLHRQPSPLYAVSYIFRLVDLGRKEVKLNNEHL